MTEESWLHSINPNELLKYLYSIRASSNRKLQLLSCAFCRRQERHTKSLDVINLLEQSERYADGSIEREQLRISRNRLRVGTLAAEYRYGYDLPGSAVRYAAIGLSAEFLVRPEDVYVSPYAWEHEVDWPDHWDNDERIPLAVWVASTISNAMDSDVETLEGWSYEREQQLWLVRDIFGNPFRPMAIDPRWLTSTVLDLSRTIYDERDFERMPILADALMDAGCDSDEIIDHCRGPGPHVRGCWVVDLLLSKE